MKKFRFSKAIVMAALPVLAASFALTSCSEDDIFRSGSSKGSISMEVSTNTGISTRAASSKQFETIDLSVDGVQFSLSASMSPYTDNPVKGSAKTRATEINTENLKTLRSTFNLNVLNSSDKSAYPAIDGTTVDNTVTYDMKKGKWIIDNEVDWPDTNPKLDFWAYSFGKANFTKNSDYKTFSYIGPDDVTNMEDILVANTVGATENDVPIHFYHALAAVRFNVADGLIDNGYQGVKVKVIGVKKSGTAVTSISENEVGNFFTWDTENSEIQTYEQALLTGAGSENLASEDDRTMFFVPQILNNEKNPVMLSFTIINDQGKEYSLSTVKLGATNWKPGYIYNYTIGNDLDGSVEVQVKEDQMKNPIDITNKTNVRIGVTKSSAAYVRVAIIANWYAKGTKDNKVVAPYTGGFEVVKKDENGNDIWIEGADGFFYSQRPILGYTESDILIKEFKPTGGAPESAYKLHLEMNIIAQAVTYDNMIKDNSDYTVGWAWTRNGDFELKDKDGNYIIPQLGKLN